MGDSFRGARVHGLIFSQSIFTVFIELPPSNSSDDDPPTVKSSAANQQSVLQGSIRALIAGAAGGALAAVVVWMVLTLQGWVWGSAVLEGLPSERSLRWCLLWSSGIGLAISLLQRHRPASALPEMAETLTELRRPDGLQTKAGARQLLGGGLALIGAGTLGPEALMTRLVAVASHRVWKGADRDLVAAAMAGSLGLFHSPLVGGAVLAGRRWQLLWRWLPGTLGGVAGFVMFRGLSDLGGGLRGVPYVWPVDQEQWFGALIAAVLAGLVGCGIGALLGRWRHWLRSLSLQKRFWLTPVLTGLILGFSVWALPLSVFSGENQLKPLVLGAWSLSPGVLLLSALAKLLLVGLCLETGWKGGQFFPVILASSALGMGLHECLPFLGGLQSWSSGVVGGSLSVLLNSPLLGLVLGLTLLQGHGAGALVIGLLVGQLLQRNR